MEKVVQSDDFVNYKVLEINKVCSWEIIIIDKDIGTLHLVILVDPAQVL